MAKIYLPSKDKKKHTQTNNLFFFLNLTYILEISRFEVPISRFFWTFFQNLQICM